MRKCLAALLLFFIPIIACFAQNAPIPAEQAFTFSAQLAPNNTINLQWQMVPGTYLYQQRFAFKIIKPKHIKIIPPVFPTGITKQDNILGTYQVYTNNLTLPLTFQPEPKQPVILQVNYQGCSESGYCYPPLTHEVTADFAKQTITTNFKNVPTQTPSKFTTLLSSNHFFAIFFGFLGFGLLLAFTPCVLPMVPILSGIIMGHGHHITTRKAFLLSLTYVLSMAFTYAIAGILVGYIGGSLQAVFQKPWVIILFSAIFVLMALSMFGLYNLQPPRKLEAFLANISGHQKKGSYIGVAVMGCLATLIISPCVTPALVAALGFLAQTGDSFLGASALFALGLGMGIPLLLIGTSTKLLPKAGHWMTTVKSFLGVLLLATAILMLSRILSGFFVMLLWALLLIGSAVYMGALTNGHKKGWQLFWRGLGIVFLVYGIILIVTAFMGHTNPIEPFTKKTAATQLQFSPVKTIQDLNNALTVAKTQNKPVMLDFYADWCISCKEMDASTFSNSAVKNALTNFVVLRADVTANDTNAKALMSKYNVVAPPTILFFNPQGQELQNLRVIGALNSTDFLKNLAQISNSTPQQSTP